MAFKIPGPKGAELGQYKPQCEAWVEAFMMGDRLKCDHIKRTIEAAPKAHDRDAAIAYVDKKSRTGVQSKAAVHPAGKRTALDTMRLAVNLMTISRKSFAEALMEAVQAEKVNEAMLAEIKTVCDTAMTAIQRQAEYRNLFKVPESIQ